MNFSHALKIMALAMCLCVVPSNYASAYASTLFARVEGVGPLHGFWKVTLKTKDYPSTGGAPGTAKAVIYVDILEEATTGQSGNLWMSTFSVFPPGGEVTFTSMFGVRYGREVSMWSQYGNANFRGRIGFDCYGIANRFTMKASQADAFGITDVSITGKRIWN